MMPAPERIWLTPVQHGHPGSAAGDGETAWAVGGAGPERTLMAGVDGPDIEYIRADWAFEWLKDRHLAWCHDEGALEALHGAIYRDPGKSWTPGRKFALTQRQLDVLEREGWALVRIGDLESRAEVERLREALVQVVNAEDLGAAQLVADEALRVPAARATENAAQRQEQKIEGDA